MLWRGEPVLLTLGGHCGRYLDASFYLDSYPQQVSYA